MRQDVREAIKKSVLKWKDVLTGAEEQGMKDCALCQLFLRNPAAGCTCTNCPVCKATGETTCQRTPYAEWSEHYDQEHAEYVDEKRVYCDECARIAKAEIRFLESLLEEDEKYFLQFNGNTQIGKDIEVIIVNEEGEPVFQCHLLRITHNGRLHRHTSVNPHVGIELDVEERIKDIT